MNLISLVYNKFCILFSESYDMNLKKIIFCFFVSMFFYFLSFSLDSSFPYEESSKILIDINIEYSTTDSEKLLKKYMLDENKGIF
jgi:hypothetical protein